MKRIAATTALTFLLTFAGSAHAFKNVDCAVIVHESIQQDDRILSNQTERLNRALAATKVSRQSAQFYEASLLEEAANNISLRLQLLSISSNLVMARSDDKSRFEEGASRLDKTSQATFKIINLRSREADLMLRAISDDQLRAAALDVSSAFKKLSAVFTPCIY